MKNYILEKRENYHYILKVMKTKTIIFLFLIVAAILGAAFFLTEKYSNKTETVITRAKVVTPKSSDKDDDLDEEAFLGSFQSEQFKSFVDLLPTETLISSLTIDFNDDGYDDEVIVVRKTGEPFFFIVPGLYNPETSVYDRLPEIPTKISRTRTFSYAGMDITGEHKTALVYQGVEDDGNFVMEIYLAKMEDGITNLVSIGDFHSDGTIFIQQIERSESYELSLSKGESYSVWVYKSDTETPAKSKDAGLNQIQEEYKWNPSSQKYELENVVRVTASRLAAKELSRIQDGTVETFADFLNGLWYKTSNSDSTFRSIYFDYDKKEVILVTGESQEVYEWDDSKLRHNGMYLTTVNSSITNLHRRFDVALVNVDEIRITIRDEINLIITETNMWDGQYKKMSLQSSFDNAPVKAEKNQCEQELEKSDEWTTEDAIYSISVKDSIYNFKFNDQLETGIYSFMKIGSYNVIELRSDEDESLLNSTYALNFGTKTITETVKKKQVERIVTDYDTIYFTPVKITPTDCFATDGRAFSFIRTSKEN